jgi:hypothetical protein
MKPESFLVCFAVFCVILASGCVQTSPYQEIKTEISRGMDDGGVGVMNSLLPEEIGFLNGSSEGVAVGTTSKLIERALYRFNISEWQGNDLVLHLFCNQRTGDPGSIAFYVVDDFGSVSNFETADVSHYWDKMETAVLAEESSLQRGWFEITIPKNVVEEKRSDNGFLALMVKLSNEGSNGMYNLLTYEQSQVNGTEKPYLIETII